MASLFCYNFLPQLDLRYFLFADGKTQHTFSTAAAATTSSSSSKSTSSKFKKENAAIASDGGDSSSSSSSEDSIPLAARRKESSGTKRKAEVLSKLFPKDSGKIGVKITTSPTNGSKVPKLSSPTSSGGNKLPQQSSLNEVSFCFPFYTFLFIFSPSKTS